MSIAGELAYTTAIRPKRTLGTDRPKPSVHGEFAAAIIEGLSGLQKSLPSSYFYDAHGSTLFDAITRLPEYYLTRVETAVLAARAADVMRWSGNNTVLVEFGSGSSRKTHLLLDSAPMLGAYVPLDVSAAALESARRRLRARYPRLDVRPVHADFTKSMPLPADFAHHRKIGFFPGSTIGNLEADEARALLARMRKSLGTSGRLVVGVDLVKDEDTLLRAYNDTSGITAAFNLNLLARINRTFGPVFDVDAFRHEAIYRHDLSRIEMHLVSLRDQTVHLLGRTFHFARGETIHTENSHKYTIAGFCELAQSAGWRPAATWTDADRLFSVHQLTVE